MSDEEAELNDDDDDPSDDSSGGGEAGASQLRSRMGVPPFVSAYSSASVTDRW